MNEVDIKRLGLILSLAAEVEGMKAENKQRELAGEALAYDEQSFEQVIKQIREVIYGSDKPIT